VRIVPRKGFYCVEVVHAVEFLDLEPVEKRVVYAGSRISRGLFRPSDGRFIHADVNASFNIIRKAIPNAFADGIENVNED
jgi:putative transposase